MAPIDVGLPLVAASVTTSTISSDGGVSMQGGAARAACAAPSLIEVPLLGPQAGVWAITLVAARAILGLLSPVPVEDSPVGLHFSSLQGLFYRSSLDPKDAGLFWTFVKSGPWRTSCLQKGERFVSYQVK